MIKFLIKKSFYDGWDNLIPSFIYNIGSMSIIAVYLFIVSKIQDTKVLAFFYLTAFFLLLFCTYIFGISGITFKWSRYEASYGSGFFDGIKNHPWHIVVYYLILLVVFFCFTTLIPLYLEQQSFLGLFLAFMQLWVSLFLLISIQYYVPLCFHLEGRNPFFILKQCFILTLDNKLYTLFVSIKTVFDFLLSALSFFFVPGLMFISLSHMDSVKLLHIRYRYVDEHHTTKKDANVYSMLEEENDNIGERSLRGMFKPWKYQK